MKGMIDGFKTPFLSPSILSCDLCDLAGALDFAEKGGARAVHIDVMDGRFVPEITYGQPVVRAMRGRTQLPFDVHLMTEKPEDQVDSFAKAGASWITFHIEAAVHIDRLLHRIHDAGCQAGVAIVPSTPVAALEEVLPLADLVLVMTVNPGFGGQKIIPSCLDKAAKLKAIRAERGLKYLISVDGGVNEHNVMEVIGRGVDVVVSGSAFFEGRLTSAMIEGRE